MGPLSVFVLSCLAGISIGFMIVHLKQKKENLDRTIGPLGLDYLSIYDQQDHYKTRKMEGVPPWPTSNTASTALASINRRNISRDKDWYDKHPEQLYSNLGCI